MTYQPTNTGRNSDGTFATGNAAGGKPKGARHRVTLAVEALLEGEAEGLTRKAVEMALAGDITALRLCLDRIAPARKDRSVTVDLPAVTSAADHAPALAAVAAAVADGDISPTEGKAIGDVLELHRRAVETADLEQRITQLEERLTT